MAISLLRSKQFLTRTLGQTTIYLFDDCSVTTHFTDQTSVRAVPVRTKELWDLAREHGFYSIEEMTRYHDFLHTFLTHKLGYAHSPTLWAVAHNEQDEQPPGQAEWEDILVFAFSRYMNVGQYADDPAFRPFKVFKIDLDKLAEEALRLVPKLSEEEYDLLVEDRHDLIGF